MKMKKFLLAAALVASAAACSDHATAPGLRTPTEARTNTSTTTTTTTTATATPDSTGQPKDDSGWLGSGGGK